MTNPTTISTLETERKKPRYKWGVHHSDVDTGENSWEVPSEWLTRRMDKDTGKGLSLADVKQGLGKHGIEVSRSHISGWRTGDILIPLSTFPALAEVLGYDEDTVTLMVADAVADAFPRIRSLIRMPYQIKAERFLKTSHKRAKEREDEAERERQEKTKRRLATLAQLESLTAALKELA